MEFVRGQDIALLLKLAIAGEPAPHSKNLAEGLSISPSEVSKALKRCVNAGLLYLAGADKRVNPSAQMEFLAQGLRYVFPPTRDSMARGAVAAEPLKSRLLEDSEPPTVWPCAEGKVRGISLAPLYKGRPKPRCAIQSYTASSLSAIRFAAEERANGTLPSNFSGGRSIPHSIAPWPNL